MSTFSTIARWTTSDITLTADTTTTLFANGNQQVVVTAKITCDNSNMEISQKDLDTLKLIKYQGSAPLARPGEKGEWISSDTHEGYLPYPSSVADIYRKQANGIYYKTFYVSTTTSVLADLKIAVEIQRFDEEGEIYTYRTNQEGDNGNTPNTYLELRPVSAPSFTADNYLISRVRVEGAEDDGAVDTIDNYYINVRYDSVNPVGLREFSANPRSMIKWKNGGDGDTFASYTGYGQPGSAAAIFAFDIIQNGNHRPPENVILPKQYEGVIILVRRADIPFYSGGQYNPCGVTATDMYGNAHDFRVRFEGGSNRNMLELMKP